MAPTKKSKALNILYVEDESVIRRNVQICLDHIFNVIVAENGEEGLISFHKNNIDLIITDINMPIKNGICMIEEIKKINPNIPCIVTTAYELDVINSLLSSVDFCKYLKKPFDVKDLLDITMNSLKV